MNINDINSEKNNNALLHACNDDKHIEKLNDLKNINDLLNYRQNIQYIISSYYKKIEELKNIVDNIDEKLKIECNHIWKRDNTYYGEYSQYKCSICKIYK